MISIIHPSRGRPSIALQTWGSWFDNRFYPETDWILSLDENDPSNYEAYFDTTPIRLIRNKNRSAVDAINNAAKLAKYDILMVVSDDTECGYSFWDRKIELEIEGKKDWILKTQDGIQDYIITMPVMDRAYYNRTEYIYHPDFTHMFCDTYMTCVADITGRKITSNLLFKHNHYSVGGSVMDEVNKKNDATWKQGEETFLRLMRQFTQEERRKISDPTMRSWLRNKGVV